MKIYYCDCCGKEIAKYNLFSYNKLQYTYHTKFPVGGYYTTNVTLHLHIDCLRKIELGEIKPKPIEEVIELAFSND